MVTFTPPTHSTFVVVAVAVVVIYIGPTGHYHISLYTDYQLNNATHFVAITNQHHYRYPVVTKPCVCEGVWVPYHSLPTTKHVYPFVFRVH